MSPKAYTVYTMMGLASIQAVAEVGEKPTLIYAVPLLGPVELHDGKQPHGHQDSGVPNPNFVRTSSTTANTTTSSTTTTTTTWR